MRLGSFRFKDPNIKAPHLDPQNPECYHLDERTEGKPQLSVLLDQATPFSFQDPTISNFNHDLSLLHNDQKDEIQRSSLNQCDLSMKDF